MSWNPHQKIYVDEDGTVWDVTDPEHPIMEDNTVSGWAAETADVLDLTDEDLLWLAAMKVTV